MSLLESTLLSVAPAAADIGTNSGSYAAVDGGVAQVGWLMVALPLLGAAVLLLGGRATDRWGPLLATVLSCTRLCRISCSGCFAESFR